MTWTRRIPAPRQFSATRRACARAVSTVARIAPGPSRISRGTMPSSITPPPAWGAITTRTPAARTASSVSRGSVVVGHQHVDLLEPEHVAGLDPLELGGIGDHDHRAGHPPQRAVGEDLGHGVVHQALLHPDGPDAHDQSVGPQLAGRQLGQVAEHRVHAGPDHAAQDDQLDPVAVEQQVGDVEGVGDDGQAPVPDLACEGQGRRAAADDDGGPVLHQGGRGAGDGALGPVAWIVAAALGETRPTGRRRHTCGRPGPRARGGRGPDGSWTAVTPRAAASWGTPARPSSRRCSTRRARRSASRMRGSCESVRALSSVLGVARANDRPPAHFVQTGVGSLAARWLRLAHESPGTVA